MPTREKSIMLSDRLVQHTGSHRHRVRSPFQQLHPGCPYHWTPSTYPNTVIAHQWQWKPFRGHHVHHYSQDHPNLIAFNTVIGYLYHRQYSWWAAYPPFWAPILGLSMTSWAHKVASITNLAALKPLVIPLLTVYLRLHCIVDPIARKVQVTDPLTVCNITQGRQRRHL